MARYAQWWPADAGTDREMLWLVADDGELLAKAPVGSVPTNVRVRVSR